MPPKSKVSYVDTYSNNSFENKAPGYSDYDSDNDNDIELQTDLLNSQIFKREKGFTSRARDILTQRFLKPLGNSLTFVKNHPIISIAATITAAPNLINGFLSIFQTTLEDMKIEDWEEASPLSKTLAIALALSAFAVNIFLAALFIPKAFNTLFNKATWKNHPIRATVALLFGLAGAVALGAIAYESFIIFMAAAVIFGTGGFVVNFATRFTSVYDGQARATDPNFNNDVKFQLRYAKHLTHINPKHIPTINTSISNAISNIDNKIPSSFYETLIVHLDKTLVELKETHPDLFLANSTKPCLKGFTTATMDIALGSLVGTIGYFIFTQKGFDGLNIINKWLNGEDSTALTDLPPWLKILLGSPAGLATFFLYLLSAKDLRPTLCNALVHVYSNPQNIPFALFLAIACGLSASSMYNIARNITLREDALFSNLINSDTTKSLYIALGAMGGFSVNTKSSFGTAFPKRPNTTLPQLKDVVEYLEDTKSHHLSSATLDDLTASHSLSSTSGLFVQPKHNLNDDYDLLGFEHEGLINWQKVPEVTTKLKS